MADYLTEIKNRALGEIEKNVNATLPEGMKLQLIHNPDSEFDPDTDPDEEDDEDEDEDEGEDGEYSDESLFSVEMPEGMRSLAFESSNREGNLSCAAACYRVVGIEGVVVAQHEPTGAAFCGALADLAEYAERRDHSMDEYEVLVTPSEILEIEADTKAMRAALELLEKSEGEFKDAEDFYRKFHWGDTSDVAVVKEIPGITAKLVHLGVGRQIRYGSKKDGKWQEYYHDFGEKTDVYPSLYAVMNPENTKPVALLVEGGEFRIEGRGLVE